MEKQNFKNHTKIVTLYHRVGLLLLLAILIGSLVNLFNCEKSDHYNASLITAISFLLVIVTYYTRAFSLKAQDRAIRAEENFRHFILTGKPLPKELRMSQIVGLRFASDEEFPSLVTKAITENLKSKDIKAAIINWKADHNRL